MRGNYTGKLGNYTGSLLFIMGKDFIRLMNTCYLVVFKIVVWTCVTTKETLTVRDKRLKYSLLIYSRARLLLNRFKIFLRTVKCVQFKSLFLWGLLKASSAVCFSLFLVDRFRGASGHEHLYK